LKASRLLRRRKKFENGQGQLHGNSPHRRPDAAPQRMTFNLRTLLPTLGGSLNASSVTFSLRFAARIDSSGSPHAALRRALEWTPPGCCHLGCK
jgi:hypothetical protein